MIIKPHNSYVFTKEELEEINNMRTAYEGMTERDKFIVREALKPYMNEKKA